ncbi:hypothetical protein ACHAW5_009298 [Stephanodiscus triporus]|uniref:FAD-binding domain-containing protein n=1 Tax=Stephanodiscus triporus TaxID=2934178 RepID=A0ABD3NMW9_9STRA
MQQGARALRSLGFFSVPDDDDDDDDGECDVGIGIHSTRHVVHKPCGTVVGEWGMRVWGGRFEKNGRKHAKRQNAHISRQNLRGMLLDMLRPDTVRWGHMLTGYSRRVDSGDDDGGNDNLKLNLTFQRRRPVCQAGGEECDDVFTTSATVLVGCDGIRSAVRAKKLGEDVAPLRYLGCCVVLGIAASPDSSLTDGETVFQTADGITRLYAMPFAKAGEVVSTTAGGILNRPTEHRGLSMWQLSFPMQEAESKKLSELGPSALKAEALKRCGQWHDPIPALLSQTPEDLITGYPCYDRATVEKDFFRAGCNAPETAAADPFVTMLGDAAHPMSPFKGQGANQALLDAVLLARKLVCIDKRKPKGRSLDDGIPAALAEFEKEMLIRSAVKVAKSADAAEFLHSHVAISEGNVTRGGAAVGGARKS